MYLVSRSLLSSYGNASSLLTEQYVKCVRSGARLCATSASRRALPSQHQVWAAENNSVCRGAWIAIPRSAALKTFLLLCACCSFRTTTKALVLLLCASHGARTATPRSAVPSKLLSRCCVPVAVPGPIFWCWLSLRQAPWLCAHSLARSFVSGHVIVSRHTQL